MKNVCRKIVTISVVMIIAIQVEAHDEIYYGTGQWDSIELGNHRVVIYVDKNSVDAVKVNVPWRRLDNVNDKNLILIDALTNQRIKNIYCIQKNKDFGEIVFQPVSGEGIYYLYYMPGRNAGNWWCPNAVYDKPCDTYNPIWRNNTAGKIDDSLAKIIAFESKSDFHSFYPMEIPVTQKELLEIIETNRGKEFLIFPENRNYPVRMSETIPYRWYKKGITSKFEGWTKRNESYAWQLGIFAPYNELEEVKVIFSDLKSENGNVLPSEQLKCINMGGKDHLGNIFTKNVKVPKGEVRSMWIVMDIPINQVPGKYYGNATVSAKGTRKYTIDVIIHVADEIEIDRGYNTPQNQSRLNWLDSERGIDDEVIAPFIPVKLKGHTVSVLGRQLRFNKTGFPEKITSTFTGSNYSVDGQEKNILSRPIRLDIIINSKVLKLVFTEPKIVLQTSGAVAWETWGTSEDINLLVKAKMECDGYIDYKTKIECKNNVNFDDIQLIVPYQKSTAKYLMGMGKEGGYTPENLEWKWDQEYANNLIWLGDVNAGLQLKLKHFVPDWRMTSFEEVGPYRDWSNEGKGGCSIHTSGQEVIVNAYVGPKKMKKGDNIILNFSLLITPFKTLDDKHWNERYYHFDNNPIKAADVGATIMNVHHANVYNPYINYPFLSLDTLKALVKKANNLHIRTKIYYTVRELSAHACELWALRQLDDEVFSRTNMEYINNDEKLDKKSIYGMTGCIWLVEHLRANYDPAWHDPSVGRDGDMSIRTQGLSRWHNYYIEGLDYLIKNVGIRGLYLDGAGYDREIMKRMRKTMDRAADSCLIDFHSGNEFHPAYGLNSPTNKYMELLPYINSVWFGEGYDYNSKPDYWLVEISGIPFGLYGEMLEGCGNAYRGMVFGSSTRYYGSCRPMNIWKLWDYFGMSGSEYIGYWDANNPVKTGNSNILASVYRKENKSMIAIGNWSDKEQIVNLQVDWKKLGINRETAKIEIPDIDDLQTAAVANISQLHIPGSLGLILIVYDH